MTVESQIALSLLEEEDHRYHQYFVGRRMLAEGYFAALGIEVRLAPTASNAQA